jgi:septal ring factor EnvC (AmiA/AmiB activator)
MIAKLSLAVAILASACTVVVLHTQVNDKITGLNTALTAANAKTSEVEAERSKLSHDLASTKGSLERSETNLRDAKSNLSDATGKLKSTEGELASANATAKETIQSLEKEKATAKSLSEELKKTNASLAAVMQENRMLAKRISTIDVPPQPQPQIKGKVTSVDPRWGFVVIDVGSSKGVRENNELMVSRDGRLIARLKITKVNSDHSIANIIDKTKLDQVLEGDQALN